MGLWEMFSNQRIPREKPRATSLALPQRTFNNLSLSLSSASTSHHLNPVQKFKLEEPQVPVEGEEDFYEAFVFLSLYLYPMMAQIMADEVAAPEVFYNVFADMFPQPNNQVVQTSDGPGKFTLRVCVFAAGLALAVGKKSKMNAREKNRKPTSDESQVAIEGDESQVAIEGEKKLDDAGEAAPEDFHNIFADMAPDPNEDVRAFPWKSVCVFAAGVALAIAKKSKLSVGKKKKNS